MTRFARTFKVVNNMIVDDDDDNDNDNDNKDQGDSDSYSYTKTAPALPTPLSKPIWSSLSISDRTVHQQHQNAPPPLSLLMRLSRSTSERSDHEQHKNIRTKTAVTPPFPSKPTCPPPFISSRRDHKRQNDTDISVNSNKKESPGKNVVGKSAVDGPKKVVPDMNSRGDHQQQNNTDTNINSNKKESPRENRIDKTAANGPKNKLPNPINRSDYQRQNNIDTTANYNRKESPGKSRVFKSGGGGQNKKVLRERDTTKPTTPNRSLENKQIITNNNYNHSPKKTVHTEWIAAIPTTPNGFKTINNNNYNRLNTSSGKNKKRKSGLPISSPKSRRYLFERDSNDAAPKRITVANSIHNESYPIEKVGVRNIINATSDKTLSTHTSCQKNNQSQTNANASVTKDPNPKCGKRNRSSSQPLLLNLNPSIHILDNESIPSKNQQRKIKKSNRLEQGPTREEKDSVKAIARTSSTEYLPIAAADTSPHSTAIPVPLLPIVDTNPSRTNGGASKVADPALKSPLLSPTKTKTIAISDNCEPSKNRTKRATMPMETSSPSLLSLQSLILSESNNRQKKDFVQDEKRVDNHPFAGDATKNLACISVAPESVAIINKKKTTKENTSEMLSYVKSTAKLLTTNTTAETDQPHSTPFSSITPPKTFEGKRKVSSILSILTTTLPSISTTYPRGNRLEDGEILEKLPDNSMLEEGEILEDFPEENPIEDVESLENPPDNKESTHESLPIASSSSSDAPSSSSLDKKEQMKNLQHKYRELTLHPVPEATTANLSKISSTIDASQLRALTEYPNCEVDANRLESHDNLTNSMLASTIDTLGKCDDLPDSTPEKTSPAASVLDVTAIQVLPGISNGASNGHKYTNAAMRTIVKRWGQKRDGERGNAERSTTPPTLVAKSFTQNIISIDQDNNDLTAAKIQEKLFSDQNTDGGKRYAKTLIPSHAVAPATKDGTSKDNDHRGAASNTNERNAEENNAEPSNPKRMAKKGASGGVDGAITDFYTFRDGRKIEVVEVYDATKKTSQNLDLDINGEKCLDGDCDVNASVKRQAQVNAQKLSAMDTLGENNDESSRKTHIAKNTLIETSQILFGKKLLDAESLVEGSTKTISKTSVEECTDMRKGSIVGNDAVAGENSSNMSNDGNKLVIEISDDSTSDKGTDTQATEALLVMTPSSLQIRLRNSRDRQLAVYLNKKWRGEHEGTPDSDYSDGNANLSLESNLPPQDPLKLPTREVIELLDDSDDDSEADGNNSEKMHSDSSIIKIEQEKTSLEEKTYFEDGQGTNSIAPKVTSLPNRGMAEEEEGPTADASMNGQQVNGKDSKKYVKYKDTRASTNKMFTRLKRKKMHEASKNEKIYERKKRKAQYAFPSSQSSDDESASSLWTDSFHSLNGTRNRPSTMKIRGSKNVISSVSDHNTNSKFQYSPSTAIKNNTCDFTGKGVSTNKAIRRRSIPDRASRRIAVASDEDGTDTSYIRHGRETSLSNCLDTLVLQRKAPPPLKNLKTVKKNITEIFQRIQFGHKKANRSIIEKSLSQQQAYNRQLASSAQTFSPRIKSIKRRLKYAERNESQSISGDGHTAIVNSSLTVLSTVNDDKVKEDTERKNLETKAQRLGVMPYQLKILRKRFTSILDALPLDQRYHPEVHEYVSKLLHAPTKNKKEKLEVPPWFEEARTDDILTPEATPNLKNPDENNADYVSIMKSFRDFCVQCKTFDCQFHITSYPDAATQACVAIQYDKRALIRQSRETFKLNKNDPFSFLIPTADNTMVLVNEGASVRFNNPTSVDVIGSNKSTDKWIDKSTYNFNSEDMLCPFCNFCCHGKEKLSKHLSRYHGDTFYCREVGSKITAHVRTGRNEPIVPTREYYHSKSLIPIQSGHYDRDSDEESNYSWYHDYRRDLMEDITDVSEKEKQIQSMWNRFLGCSPVVIADKDVPQRCFYFIQEHAMDLGELEWELYQLIITFWERHLLSVIHVEKLVHLFHVKQETKSPKQKNNVLTPRKKALFSRLYMIFESLGEGMFSRLRDALRRNDVGSNDVVGTPMLSKRLQPKWTKKRSITTAMRMRGEDISRPFFFPCSHAGKCNEANGCTCLENDCLCTKHCVWGEYGDNFFPGCSCTGDCTISKMCPCRSANRECDPDICRCCASTDGDRRTCGCANMDVSLAKRAHLLIGRSQVEGGGLGLYTKNCLKKGDYIDEYIGELIKREYQLGRSEEYYFDHSDDYITDATHQGNKTRYVNHSLTPNIEAKHRFVNGEKRIAFYAKHDIPAQTELFYSYGKGYNNIWHSKGLSQLCVDSDDSGYLEVE